MIADKDMPCSGGEAILVERPFWWRVRAREVAKQSDRGKTEAGKTERPKPGEVVRYHSAI